MRGAILAASLTLAAAAASVAPEAAPTLHAQESPQLASLEIELWPEFDRRAAVLVILRGQLADEVSLPATVSLRIPASASGGGPSAVASAAAEGADLFTRDYEITGAGDSLLLTLITPDPLFQVEFYDSLPIDSANRSYTYVWPGDFAVDQLSVVVQEPIGASALSIEPDLGERTVGPDQLVYRSAEVGPFELGRTLTINVSYLKTDPHTSLEILSPGEAESGADGGAPSWIVLVAVIAALSAVAGAVVLWRRQNQPAAAPAPPTPRRTGRGASRPREGPSSQTFCPECGEQLLPDYRFCPGCGTAAKEK